MADNAASPVLTDLRERLTTALVRLHDLESERRRHGGDASRLGGKLEGVTLAISYVDEYLRGAHATYTTEQVNPDPVSS